jgi:tetratricopeptide (TPR) repeat protein
MKSPAVLCFYLTSAVGLAFAQQTAAEELIAAGHWKRVRTIVESMIRQSPDDPFANFLLSQVRAAFGDRTAPLALAEKAVARDGRTAKYHRQLAEVLGVTAQHSNAFQQLFLARRFRKEIDAALVLDPRDVQAQRDLLEYFLLAPSIVGGDRVKARATAERIAAIDPAEGFLAHARVAEFQKQSAEAASFLRTAAGARPPSCRAYIALAQFYLASGHRDLAAAEAAALQAVKLEEGRVDAWSVLVAVYAERSAWSELDSALERASRAVPDDPAPYFRAAERLVANGRDPDRAERYLRRYLAEEPEGNEPPAAQATELLARLRQNR